MIKPLCVGPKIGASIPGPNTGDHRIELRQVAPREIVDAEQNCLNPDLPQRLRHLITRARTYPTRASQRPDIRSDESRCCRRKQSLRRDVRIVDYIDSDRNVPTPRIGTRPSVRPFRCRRDGVT